ncbi:MAG TPA: PAS domain S-box protein, partial [Chloroflexota bacterium]|nr:PAS domain S-box protein [Chloroflexota bacterium]
MSKWLQTNWRWLVWTAVSVLLYVLVFWQLTAQSGPPGALLIIPVFLIAWRWGWVAGLLSSTMLGAVNYLLGILAGLEPTAVNGQLLGTAALIVIGGVAGWISDITHELKRLRDQLRAQLEQQQAALILSEQLFATFMEQTPALAFIKDAHGRLQYANSAMQQTMISSEWQGKTTAEYLHPILAAQAVADDQQAMQQGVIVVERQLPDQNGEMHTYRTHKFVIRQGDGPPLLGALAIDITERKQMEDALRASEEQFRKAFHTIPIAMGIQRADSGHFQDVNEAFIQLSGYGREEMIGHTSRELNMWADENEQQPVVAALRRGEIIRDYEYRFRRKTGEEGAGILTAERLEINGADCYLL